MYKCISMQISFSTSYSKMATTDFNILLYFCDTLFQVTNSLKSNMISRQRGEVINTNIKELICHHFGIRCMVFIHSNNSLMINEEIWRLVAVNSQDIPDVWWYCLQRNLLQHVLYTYMYTTAINIRTLWTSFHIILSLLLHAIKCNLFLSPSWRNCLCH